MSRPVVNQDECIGCGTCEQVSPEVFELAEDGLAHVIKDEGFDEFKAEIDEAIEECPTAAISWE